MKVKNAAKVVNAAKVMNHRVNNQSFLEVYVIRLDEDITGYGKPCPNMPFSRGDAARRPCNCVESFDFLCTFTLNRFIFKGA